jgi:hypothetical protein
MSPKKNSEQPQIINMIFEPDSAGRGNLYLFQVAVGSYRKTLE